MKNFEIAEIFQHMAEILEFIGSQNPTDRFRMNAYVRASMALRNLPDDVEKYAAEKKLLTIPGIGAGLAKKIEEYIKTGKIHEYAMMKAMVPKGIFELMAIPFLGPKKVKVLHQKLGIESVKDLEKAVKQGKVQKLPGFGEKSAEKILEGIEMKKESRGRMLLGEVYFPVMRLLENLKKIKEVKEAQAAGSFRRREATIGDIDILLTTKKEKNIGKDAEKIMKRFSEFKEVKKVLAEGETKISVLTNEGFQVDIRIVEPAQFGSALQYFTGSKNHNIHLRTFAKSRGFKLSEYGFFKGKKLAASRTEEDCYKALGMQYIPPELRTDSGEIEAALKHKIPADLIELSDLRGDLHVHSNWSDGAYSIEEIALAAQKLGYEYIAVTDHSSSARIAGGLNLARIRARRKEIEKVQDKLKIKILNGAEIDILADGSLDYPDEVLKDFDIVVASIHLRFAQDNTDRILRAMESPYVHIIGHPSGRLIGERKEYPLDYEKIFKCAVKTKTAIEINSHYKRFDLQDIYMRDAQSAGVKFAINSDAHSIGGLWLVELGCKWARRGWVQKEDVINAMGLKGLMRLLGK